MILCSQNRALNTSKVKYHQAHHHLQQWCHLFVKGLKSTLVACLAGSHSCDTGGYPRVLEATYVIPLSIRNITYGSKGTPQVLMTINFFTPSLASHLLHTSACQPLYPDPQVAWGSSYESSVHLYLNAVGKRWRCQLEHKISLKSYLAAPKSKEAKATQFQLCFSKFCLPG